MSSSFPLVVLLSDIKYFGTGARFWFKHSRITRCNQFGHFAYRIIQIAEGHGLSGTCLHTRRLFAFRQPVGAEIAFLYRTDLMLGIQCFFIRRQSFPRIVFLRRRRDERARVVRARYLAIAAADALCFVNRYDAIRLLLGRLHRAYVRAGGIIALVAEHRQKILSHFRIGAGFALDHLTIKNSRTRSILLFAGNGARIASDTSLQVDHHSVSHRCLLRLVHFNFHGGVERAGDGFKGAIFDRNQAIEICAFQRDRI